MKRAFFLAIVIAGLLNAVVPAQSPTSSDSNQPGALKFFKNYFVTGDYVVGGVGLKGMGVGGIATGFIGMPEDAPEQVDVLAAFLYWQVVTKDGTGDAGAIDVTFGPWTPTEPTTPGTGIPLRSEAGPLGKALGTGTPPCWSSGGGTGSSGGAFKTFTYRTDVLRFLHLDETTGKYRLRGWYQVQLPDGDGVTALGASLVVIYRDLTKPLSAIVLYDGAYTMDQSTQEMFQSISWFYDGTSSAKLTHIVGSGQANKSEILRFNTGLTGETVVFVNPFRSSAGPGWDNRTFTADANGAPLAGLPTAVNTSVDHEGLGTFDCLTWAAVIYETPVTDTDGDGLLDAWESQPPPLDPYGQSLPNLYAMGARADHKDVFVEIGWMTTGTNSYSYGGVTKPAHSHMPTPAAIRLMGDAFKNAPVSNPDGSSGIRLHVDAGDLYPSGEADDYMIRDAEGLDLARGGDVPLDETITTPPCTRDPLVDPVWKCQFQAYPGTVGWKTGFRHIRDEVVGTTDGSPVPPPPTNLADEDPCDAPGSNCVRRFDADRMDSFHYAFFAHAVGMPKSLNPCVNTSDPANPVEGADVDGHCQPPFVENPLYFVPRTNAGIGDFPGRELLLTLGAFSDRYGRPGGTDFMVGSTFFHELGHNFELRHGAWKDASGTVLSAPNCVPTYLSAMNYLYQLRGLLDDDGTPHLDFSRAAGTAPADRLNESSGTDAPLSFATRYRIGWYAPLAGSYFEAPGHGPLTTVAGRHCDGSPTLATDVPMVRVDARTAAGAIDWNANGVPDGYASQDLNFNGRTAPPAGSLELPEAFDDWANIRLNQIGAARNVGGLFIDALGRTLYGPLSADLSRGDWSRGDWSRGDWSRGDWSRGDWGRAEWGDSDQGDTGRYGWSRGDWSRGDWSRGDWGRGDDGRGDYGGGDLFVGDANNPGGELDFETATLLANTPPYEFRACIIGRDIGCVGEGTGVRADWKATNEGNELQFVVYRVEGTELRYGVPWLSVGDRAAVLGHTDYWLIDGSTLVKNHDYLYFAVAVYEREVEGATVQVLSEPSNIVPIVGPNRPPIANGQSVITPEDTSRAVTLTGSDVDGDALTYAVTTPPAHGMLSGTAPNLTYTPVPDYNGPDRFEFTASDGEANAPAAVSITVTPLNDTPVATAGLAVTVVEDTPAVIMLTGSDMDGDPLTYAVTTPPAHGMLSGTAPNLAYTPAPNFNGNDSLAFTVSDGALTSTPATVSITVTAVNDAPVAVNDSYPMPGAGVLWVAPRGVLANDTDLDSAVGLLTAVLGTSPSRGTLILNPEGSFTYTPTPPISGSDSFTYQARDSSGALSNVATVRIAAYALVGIQNVPPATISRAKAGSSVPMKWQFKDGSIVVNSSGVHHSVTVTGPASYLVSDTDPGSSSFRYDATTNTWYFNLQTKDANAVAYPIGSYLVTITPTTPGYLPSSSFKLALTK